MTTIASCIYFFCILLVVPPPVTFCVISFFYLLPRLSCAIEWCVCVKFLFRRYLFTDTTCLSVYFPSKRNCLSTSKVPLGLFFVLTIAVPSNSHIRPSYPFRLAGERG